MVTSAQCGQARIQSVSHVPRAATTTAAARSGKGGKGTVPDDGRPPLLLSAAEEHGTAWEQVYPGTEGQLRSPRSALRPPLRSCPMADDVIVLKSELGGNAVRHSMSCEAKGTFTARFVASLAGCAGDDGRGR